MEITDEIITKLDEFVEVVAEDQHKPQQKFVWEMLFGMVAAGLGKDPLMLWTNLKVRGDGTAQFVVRAFLRRWAVEDCGRVIKQEFKLEKVRVEGWVSIRRSIILAGLAYDFLCYIGRLGKAIVEFITTQVRAFREVKKVIAYRLRQGLAELWEEGLLFRPSNFG